MVQRNQSGAEQYDEMALATGWQGPVVAFHLLSPYIKPGQIILDLGIGTGLSSELFFKYGLHVIGLDISQEMLDICKKKGCVAELLCHDLNTVPYPVDNAAVDHVISIGVFQFFKTLDLIFGEVNRVIKNGGMFVFITGDRKQNELAEVVVDSTISGMKHSITMYRHTIDQITRLLEKNEFILVKTSEINVYMDTDRSLIFPARSYLAQKSLKKSLRTDIFNSYHFFVRSLLRSSFGVQFHSAMSSMCCLSTHPHLTSSRWSNCLT